LLLWRLHALDAEQLWLFIGAARYLDQVNACVLQPFGDLQAFLKGKAAFLKIGAVQLNLNGKIGADDGAHRIDYEQQHSRAVFQTAAPAIFAAIGQRAEELRQ
jgi:hypothetical protein